MQPTSRHQDIVGNTSSGDQLQRWTILVPHDDMQSWEGAEGPNVLTNFDGESQFDEAFRATAAHQPQWVCRAATGSDATKGEAVATCAGEQTHETTATSQPFAEHTSCRGQAASFSLMPLGLERCTLTAKF